MSLILMETKQHTSLTMWKVLMLQTPPVIIKKWVPHLKHDQQYVYHQQMKETQVEWVVVVR
jgi:hypothetical protein